MKIPLVVFGAGEIAQLAHYYFSTDSSFEVAAFVVDREFLKERTFCKLPVVAFDELEQSYPPLKFQAFVALSYAQLNAVRKEKYLAVKKKGYKIASYVSSKAMILNAGAIGENCFILEDSVVQPFVTIGNNVTVWSGAHIGHHSRIHDHTFIAPHVAISGGVEIEESCFIGINATLRDNIKIGARCVLGAGTLLLQNAEPEGLYIGTATPRAAVLSDRLQKI